MAHLSTARGRALLHQKSVLELGAGNGDLAAFALERCRARCYLATDLPHRAQELRKRFHRRGEVRQQRHVRIRNELNLCISSYICTHICYII